MKTIPKQIRVSMKMCKELDKIKKEYKNKNKKCSYQKASNILLLRLRK